MSGDDVQKVRLKLLTTSQQRLQLAKSAKWEELERFNVQWESLLSETLDKYGDDIACISEQLQKDNNQLMLEVEKAQIALNNLHNQDTKNYKQVKQYLK